MAVMEMVWEQMMSDESNSKHQRQQRQLTSTNREQRSTRPLTPPPLLGLTWHLASLWPEIAAFGPGLLRLQNQ